MPWKPSPEPGELLRQARASLRAAMPLLARPSEAQSELERAIGLLTALRRELERGSAPVGLARDAAQLRREVRRGAALLEGAAAFHFGRAQALCAAAAGYTAYGGSAAPAPLRSVSVEG